MYSSILNETVDENILVITLNRNEKKNAINVEVIEALMDLFHSVHKDPSIGAIVLTGGDQCFSAGRDRKDLQMVKELPVDKKREEYRRLKVLHRSFKDCPVPIIAAVTGYALGLGAGIVTWCDMAIMGKDTKYGYPEAKLGILPGLSSIDLKKWVSKKVSFELLGCCSIINAEEAHRLSLVNKVVQEDEVFPTAMNFARNLVQNGPGFSRLLKQYHNSLFMEKDELEMEYSLEMMALGGLITSH